ncbi:TPA: hypothetical protein I7147_22060 [Vibrio vulnificus]|uniref:DUF6979 family protein n=1 Tax=Vibrio vulnificus TaxID=672 RepID=UPI0019D4D004|nr:hypothetical protein [Vibrio vulnificus]HBC3497199.1 hypothetical protein [Vibrio parahaemolyticus]ELM6650555.1 hypothetical protein [Vibrio vulnificus]ELV8592027.1 hypothetical protein [Vibrio vulnificus]MBN8133839.1 hypothetical protein [Vibrio vulnificus]MBN8138429.1 hypothetical protein [Vibrio vulnificus]
MKIFKLDIVALVSLAVSYADKGHAWSFAWTQAYHDLGGVKESCPKKPCPRAASKALYELGLLKISKQPLIALTDKVIENMPKNGWYCYLALCELKNSPNIEHARLWCIVREQILLRYGAAPKRDEGSVKIAMALYKAELVHIEQLS